MELNIEDLIRELNDNIDTLIDLIKTTKNSGIREWAMETLNVLMEERIRLMNWLLSKS